MRIQGFKSRNAFGAYLQYSMQSLIREAKENCTSPAELATVRQAAEDLYDLFPENELTTTFSQKNIWKNLFKKEKQLIETIYLDDLLIGTISYEKNQVSPQTRIKAIAQKLKEEQEKELNI